MPKRPAALANSVAARRSAAAGEACAYKSRWAPSMQDAGETTKLAALLSNDVAVALGAELEDLETGHEFRTSLHRVFLRVLRMAQEREEVVLFFNEAIPGYTMMLLKKGAEAPKPQARNTKGLAPAPSPFDPNTASLEATPEGQAATLMIEAFFERTHSRAMTIEHPDALFVFFPAADLRRNVRDMGFYFVDR
jgi:hypothetical protein